MIFDARYPLFILVTSTVTVFAVWGVRSSAKVGVAIAIVSANTLNKILIDYLHHYANVRSHCDLASRLDSGCRDLAKQIAVVSLVPASAAVPAATAYQKNDNDYDEDRGGI